MNLKILHTAVTVDIAQIYEYINRAFLITTHRAREWSWGRWGGIAAERTSALLSHVCRVGAGVWHDYISVIIVTDVPAPTYLGTSANIPIQNRRLTESESASKKKEFFLNTNLS